MRVYRMQFSKKLCVYSWGILTTTIFMEFILQWTNRGTMGDIVIALISFATVFINGGYITQNIFRDKSLNDNSLKVTQDGDKLSVKKEVTCSSIEGGTV